LTTNKVGIVYTNTAACFINIFMSTIKFNNHSRPFKEALDAKVKAYFEAEHISGKGNRKLYVKTVILIALSVLTYATLIFTHLPLFPAIFLWILMGLLFASIGFNIMHDAAHGSFSSKKTVNKMFACSLDLLGGSSYMWKVKHNIVHHTYTNIAGEDDDISKHPLFRFSPQQKRYWFHRFQYIYCSVLYLFTSLIWIVYADYEKLITKHIENTPITRMRWSDKVIFWGFKLLSISLFFVIPGFVLGWIPALVGFLVMHGVLGVTLSYVFQMAHCVEDAQFPAPDPHSNKIENEWALHEVATTANFAMNSKFISWFTGGLNFQIEHHLFPKISHVHYKALSPLVQQTCREFDVPYHAYPTFGKAIISHLRHLRNLGRR
jgi:linoleoyl-CoA desaturase